MRISRGFFAASVLALLAACGASLAQSASPPASGASAAASADSSAANQVSALGAEIQALSAETRQLLQRHNQLEFAKPKPPASNAPQDVRKQYEQSLRAWEAERENLLKQRQRLDEKAMELSKRLGALEAARSSGQREEIEAHRKMLETARKRLAQANPAASSGGKRST